MFGKNKKRINSLNLSSLIEIKPLSERFLDVYWNNQIKKAENLDKLNLSPESKLKKLAWNSWISLGKSTLTYLTDLPKNFYKKQIDKDGILYVSPLEAKRLHYIDKIHRDFMKN